MRVSAVATLVALATLAMASPAHAQGDYGTAGRFEITPFGGYQWGGSFDTDASNAIPEGKLSANDAASWGVIISRYQWSGTAGEIFYLRQDADVSFDPRNGDKHDVGQLASNYIQIGGRRALRPLDQISPFISASLGANILDADDADATWRFAFTLGGGVRVPLSNPRIALRLDARWMATLIPSGDLESWCGLWGCYSAEGSTLLNQGQASAGLSIGF